MSKVTVGLPVYNCARYVGKAIESIIGQTFSDLTLIVSDNASSDGTADICAEYAKTDSRIRFIRNERNVGVFRNHDAVFKASDSRYFKWMSGSDWCHSEMLAKCVAAFEHRDDAVLVCPQVSFIDEHGLLEDYDGDFALESDDAAARFVTLLRSIKLSNIFNGLIRADALKKTGLNRPFQGSDIVWLAELALHGKFLLLPERLWSRRISPESSSKFHDPEQRRDFFSGTDHDYDRLLTWKRLRALSVSVVKAPIDSTTKLRCAAFLAKNAVWDRQELWQEIVELRHPRNAG